MAFAEYLDSKNIEWKYENIRFDLGDTVYIPDFYMPQMNIYVEIKGWMKPEFLEKMKKMDNLHPDINLLVINRPPPYNWVF